MKLTTETILNALLAITAVAVMAWLVRNTEWAEQELAVPPHGEAALDNQYPAKQLVRRLGATVVSPPNLDRLPPVGATLLLDSWAWDLFPEREQALRRWIADGGHLVVSQWRRPKWIPIEERSIDAQASKREPRRERSPLGLPLPRSEDCHAAAEPAAVAPAFETRRAFRLCNGVLRMSLTSKAPVLWSLDGADGPEILRVAMGRGSVTVFFGSIAHQMQIFDGDNALAFTAALDVRRGREIWFVQSETRTPLLALIWQVASPAVLLATLLLTLLLWRQAVRFGPRAPVPPLVRRSIVEQIRGTASFIFQRNAAALHRAQLRALAQAAQRSIRHHDRLDRRARAEAIAAATALDATALARAMDPALRHPRRELVAVLALLETAARRLSLNR